MTDADTGTDDGPSIYSRPARNPTRSRAQPIPAVATRSATTLREHPFEANLGRLARVNVDDVSFREEYCDIPSRAAPQAGSEVGFQRPPLDGDTMGRTDLDPTLLVQECWSALS